jgi:acyl-CoA synthetase (AMP-forming)/AMP-acid ligase II
VLPHPLTIGALLNDAAARWPDRIFLRDENGRQRTFSQFRGAARAVSRAFIACDGAKGDRVAIWAPNSGDWAVVAAGAMQIGLQIVPINTRFKGAEAADAICRSRARWLFVGRKFLGVDHAAMLEGHELPFLDETIHLDEAFPAWTAKGERIYDVVDAHIASVKPEDTADILFTSGTTGRPKGAMSSHAQNLRTFEAWSDAVGLREGDRYLIVNPFFHSFGYKAGWLACLIRGATALPMAVFDAAAVARRIKECAITVLPGPPTLFQSLLDLPPGARETSGLRLAVTGAASVPPTLVLRMRQELGIADVLTAYGLTESCGVVSTTHAGDPPELVAATCGRPIPGVEVRIVDAEGRDVSIGQPGELLVRGFNVMKGYLDDPVATAEAIDPAGWLRTGDVATQDPDGYLRITDRLKDMFICGGFNCYPAEIEARILEYPEVARVAVVGRPDLRMGEVAHAVVVPVAGATRDSDAFLSWCREAMANYKVPRSVEWVEELPLNASGKVQHFLLNVHNPK